MSALKKNEFPSKSQAYRAMVESGKVTLVIDGMDPFVGFIAPVHDDGVDILVGILDKSICYDAIFLGQNVEFTAGQYVGRMKVHGASFRRDYHDPEIHWAQLEILEVFEF